MIKLYGFGGMPPVEDVSPPVLTVMAYMKLADIPFEMIRGEKYLRKAPKGKLPFIEDKGTTLADSHFILAYLKEHYVNLDAELTDTQIAESHLIARSMNEHFYWIIVYSRWQTEEGWANLMPQVFAQAPAFIRPFIAAMIRKSVLKQLHAQGHGRHSTEEIMSLAKHSLDSVVTLLGDKKGDKSFYFGDKPSSIDAILYAHLTQLIHLNVYPPLYDLANSYDSLVSYVTAIQSLMKVTKRTT